MRWRGMLDTRLTVQLPDDRALFIDNISIRAENQDDLHQLRMEMSLPSEIGEAFEVGIDLRGDANKITRSSGNFYLKAAQFQAAGFDQILQAYDIDLPLLRRFTEQDSNAQLELWGELQGGKITRVHGRSALVNSGDKNAVSADCV